LQLPAGLYRQINQPIIMKRITGFLLVSLLSLFSSAQSGENTLLWKISGPGLEKPSYLYGTIHMICAEDAILSVNLKKALRECDELYLEVDLDNMIEMLGMMGQLKMRGDTTLRDLLTEEEYKRVKDYFTQKGSILPFQLLETYKPLLAASTLEQAQEEKGCETMAIMEQVIMQDAKSKGKKVSGLETMAYQAGVIDSIPYRLQARQLLEYIDSASTGDASNRQLEELFAAYKSQDLKKLESLMVQTDAGMAAFTEILLYHRNENWVRKLRGLLPGRSLVIAVGAGHLPGDRGLIDLLRKAGYTVTPVENRLVKTAEI
jgi:uncharacterized protein YbaP (TraB family)